MPQGAWIGLSRPLASPGDDPRIGWVWQDGTPYTLGHVQWLPGQPQNAGGFEACAMLRRSQYGLLGYVDVDCDNTTAPVALCQSRHGSFGRQSLIVDGLHWAAATRVNPDSRSTHCVSMLL